MLIILVIALSTAYIFSCAVGSRGADGRHKVSQFLTLDPTTKFVIASSLNGRAYGAEVEVLEILELE
jgi:hypothetical protein